MRLLLATRNPGKIREIREICARPEGEARGALEWVGLDAFPLVPESPETAETFAANARMKAAFYAEATGLCTLADDSGLVVDALGGRPGVHSARFADEPKSDDANNRKLLAELEAVPEMQRTARFCCAMAFADPRSADTWLETAGTVEGTIINQPRGLNGFGYDPLFLIPLLGRTIAELPGEQKNALSHRGTAMRAMLPQIEAYLRRAAELARG